MDSLRSIGIPDEFTEVWRNAGIEQLTTIQSQALSSQDVLDGKNALIIAPTSAGKTFVAEVLAVRAAQNMKRVLYVVPFKALAEEKFEYLREVYGPLGISVAISSGDRTEFDDDIRRGNYLLTVVVNEKLAQLLAQAPGMLSDCALAIFDEVQLIRDTNRGAVLEMLLTRLRLWPTPPQIIALSGTVGALNGFDSWLGATIIAASDRPVPLIEHYVAPDGRSYVIRDGSAVTEQSFGQRSKDEIIGLISERRSTEKKQVLVFRTTVDAVQRVTQAIASSRQQTNLPQHIVDGIALLEDSDDKVELEALLRRRVAYHHAGLSLQERMLVENAFRKGHLDVLVSTTTLSMGVNLPADTVIVADHSRWNSATRGYVQIDVAEYKNCAGRAGRLGKAQAGESYLLYENQDDPRTVMRRFIQGTPEAIESAIPKSDIGDHLLVAAATGLAKTPAEAVKLFESSFAGSTVYSKSGMSTTEVKGAIDRLVGNGLIALNSNGTMSATALGEVTAHTGITVATSVKIIQFLQSVDNAPSAQELIFELCSSSQTRNAPPYVRKDENLKWVIDTLKDLGVTGTAGGRLAAIMEGRSAPNSDDLATLKRCSLALRWINGESARHLTQAYRVGLGYIRQLGETLSWLAEATAQLGKVLGVAPNKLQEVGDLAQTLHYGVSIAAVQFASLRVPGVGRNECIRLATNSKHNFASLDELLDATATEITGIISPRLLRPLQEAVLRRTTDTQKRLESGLLIRARVYSTESEALVKSLFEAHGNDLERAIEDLLNSRALDYNARRITRQRSGEMDISIPQTEGGCIIISVTGSDDEAKPVSWNKAREVLGAVGVDLPIHNYVVVGRPDFHDLAKRNAEAMEADPTRPMLLLTVAQLGDLYLQVLEGRISRDDLLLGLRIRRGYGIGPSDK